MLRPGFDGGAILDTFRQLWATQRHVVVPTLLEPETALALRQRLAGEVAPFYIADRGRYHLSTAHVDEELFAALGAFAGAVAGGPLHRLEQRWLRFVRGDYQLTHGDHLDRATRGRHLELTLDFSAAETDQGESIFTDGRATFIIPQLPLSLALVERDDSLYRYDRYFNHKIGDAEVWRLRLSLGFPR
jgi:hypothetical protein